MSKHLHLNLIRDEELVSSSPVRTQIIAPVFVAVITLSTFAWWLYIYTGYNGLKRVNIKHVEINEQIQPDYRRVLDLTAREKEISALSAQINAFRNSRLQYGSVLSSIPKHVDPNIQFTMLQLVPPPSPLFEKDKLSRGPTNTFETAEFHITGKIAGSNAFSAVDRLMHALEADSYTNLIESVYIPKDSFRQDLSSSLDNREYLRFELNCRCRPRRFQ